MSWVLGLLGWLSAQAGYVFDFARDHANHPAYKTEWWYYTGHLQAESGRRYGYELTFFRSGVDRTPLPKGASPWRVRDLYLAHFAVTDEAHHRFYYDERLNRAALDRAGASNQHYRVWNGDWKAEQVDANHELLAQSGDFRIDLALAPLKQPVVHGHQGISRKGDCASCASHYYSISRLGTVGYLTVNGQTERVTGLSWMDHEFGSNQLEAKQVGWDWFSVQLEDNSELMLYLLREKNGGISRHSSGTLIRKDGTKRHLKWGDFQVTPLATWRSPHSGGVYPSAWQIRISSESIDLNLKPTVADQELLTGHSTGVTYWEGSVGVTGTKSGQPVRGQGYVEMTGYAEAFRQDI